MCQIVPEYMQTGQISPVSASSWPRSGYLPLPHTVNRLYHGTVVALRARVASCGCANAFCGPTPALKFNFHDVIAEIGNVLRK